MRELQINFKRKNMRFFAGFGVFLFFPAKARGCVRISALLFFTEKKVTKKLVAG